MQEAEHIANKKEVKFRVKKANKLAGELQKHKNYFFYFKPDEDILPASDQVLEFNPKTNLFSNACLSPRCHFFQVPCHEYDFQKHLANWNKKLPINFHKIIKLCYGKNMSIEKTFDYCMTQYGKKFPNDYGLSIE